MSTSQVAAENKDFIFAQTGDAVGRDTVIVSFHDVYLFVVVIFSEWEILRSKLIVLKA